MRALTQQLEALGIGAPDVRHVDHRTDAAGQAVARGRCHRDVAYDGDIAPPITSVRPDQAGQGRYFAELVLDAVEDRPAPHASFDANAPW